MALGWLARRELSTAQVRARLSKQGFEPAEVSEAIARLHADRALDDRRMAAAFARTAGAVKRRGRERIRRELEALGVDRETARHAVDEAQPEETEAARLERALDRRLRGPLTGTDQARRVYQYLLRQGFPSGLALAAIRRRATCAIDFERDA
jgi:regulatory protein